MEQYQRLSLSEREELSRYLAMNYTYRQIGTILHRSPSTICREILRGSNDRKVYRAIPAHRHALHMAHISRKQRKLEVNTTLQKQVMNYLQLRWAPEQIAKRLKILYPNDMSMYVSHETIYAYIYVHPRMHLKRQLLFYLRRKHKYRRVRDKVRKNSRPIQDFISIDDRPPEVASRKIAGHWEGDLIMGAGNHSAIGTLVERTTRMTFLVKLKARDAGAVRKAFTNKFSHLPKHMKRSLTYDQGQEMADHAEFTKNTKIKVYFAHPHSPWERGTSENTNSLVRDFFPKETDFSKISNYKIQRVQELLNDRPRKVLNWYTPREVFTKTVALEP